MKILTEAVYVPLPPPFLEDRVPKLEVDVYETNSCEPPRYDRCVEMKQYGVLKEEERVVGVQELDPFRVAVMPSSATTSW